MITIKEILQKYSKTELAEICNKLNSWEWDARLGSEPDNFDGIPNFILNKNYKLPTKSFYIRPYIDCIIKMIGEKEFLKYHHLKNLGRTKMQFEMYWIKRKFQKLFGLGLWSRKNIKAIAKVLGAIAEKNTEEWIEKSFYNNK